jgi:ketosteroid isomerase-like protein
VLWAGGPPEGRFEVEFLVVHEVNEAGLCAAIIFFDPDDPRAAQREAWARWAAIEPASAELTAGIGETIDAWNAKDLDGMRARFTEDLVVEDHRRTGTGRSEGREAYLRSVIALWELAPDSRLEGGWFWLATAPHGGVFPCRRSGTLPGGGEFISDFLVATVLDRGRVKRMEIFEMDAAEAALARFEALRPPSLFELPPSLSELRGTGRGTSLPSLRIPPNAATRAQDRQLSLVAAGDWEAVRALHSPRLVFDDRRSGLRTTVDGEAYLAGLRWGRPGLTELTPTVLATAGDRLELRHNRFTRTEDGTLLFEVDTLALAEVDADGRLESIILFDPDDRAAADAELSKRYLDSDAHSMPPAVVEFFRAINEHDLGRARAALPDDFVLDDHRRLGLGRIDGADAYIASFAAFDEQSKDGRIGDLYQVAEAAHGRVGVSRTSGTNQEGGAFEIVYAIVTSFRAGRIASVEFFEVDDLDKALARFEALRPAGE